MERDRLNQGNAIGKKIAEIVFANVRPGGDHLINVRGRDERMVQATIRTQSMASPVQNYSG
jgi:hypothetical protein